MAVDEEVETVVLDQTLPVEEQFDAILSMLPSHDHNEDDYRIETVQLDSTGYAFLFSRTVPESIAVANLGTTTLIVQADHRSPAPTGLSGPQSVQIGSGCLVAGMAPSRLLSFYGRPGEYLVVQRYRDERIQAGQVSPERWFTIGNLSASALIYTTPWGLPAEYGGFSARETTEVAGQRVRFRFRDGGATGPIIETVSLAPGESTSDHDIHSLLTTPSIYLENLAGGGTLELSVRVR